MNFEALQNSYRPSSTPEDAEIKFKEILDTLYKRKQIDKATHVYFSRALRNRPSLLVTLKFIKEHLPEACVLDLGCGLGSLEAEICMSKEYECVGLDKNRAFVQLASLRLKLHGYRNVSFIVGDLRTLPFKMGLFHTVILHDVAFAVNLYGFIEEIARVLKKRGRFIFDVPLANFFRLIPVQRPFIIKYSKREVTIVLKKKGFIQEYVFLHGMPPILHEYFHMPTWLTKGFSRLLMSFPNRLQELVSEFWFAVVFVERFGGKNAQIT